MRPVHSPLSGLFRHPCGVWVAPYRMRSGAVWFRPIPASARFVHSITRQRSAQGMPVAGEGL